MLERLDRLGAAGARRHARRRRTGRADGRPRRARLPDKMRTAGLAEALEAGILEIDGRSHRASRIRSCARPCPRARRRLSNARLHARLAGARCRNGRNARDISRSRRPCRTGEVAAVVEEAAESVRRARSDRRCRRAGRARRPAHAPFEMSMTCAGACSTAPTGSARRATAAVRSPSSSRRARKRHRRPDGAPTVLVRLARVVEVVDGPREAVGPLSRGARRGCRATTRSRRRFSSASPAPWRDGRPADRGLAHAELAVERASRAGRRCASMPTPWPCTGSSGSATGHGIPREQMERGARARAVPGARGRSTGAATLVLRLPARLGVRARARSSRSSTSGASALSVPRSSRGGRRVVAPEHPRVAGRQLGPGSSPRRRHRSRSGRSSDAREHSRSPRCPPR